MNKDIFLSKNNTINLFKNIVSKNNLNNLTKQEKQKDLDEASKCEIILGTFAMASEALDIPDLNTLMMLTPRREIEQSVGRILRKKDHIVQPLIIDIVDQLKSFINQGKYRIKFYKKKKNTIKNIIVTDNEIISENVIDYLNLKSEASFNQIVPEDVDFID